MWKQSMILQLLFVLWFSEKTICSNLEVNELKSHLQEIYENAENLLISFNEVLDELKNYSHTDPSNVSEDVKVMPSSCLSAPMNTTGMHVIKVPGQKPFKVLCDSSLAGLGWIVIQKRTNGSLNFFRNWQEYREGFGNLNGEFFLGLENIRAITALEPYELYIHLEDFNKTVRHARYDEFAIDNEVGSYALNVLGRYTGTAGDSLRSHYRMKFSTYDRDNDHEFNRNCAFSYVGAWWYNACLDSNLNGQYIDGGKYEEKMFARGMCWRSWHGHNYGYKITQIMIRPKCRKIGPHNR